MMLGEITEDDIRNRQIINEILKLPDRKILVLSERVVHLNNRTLVGKVLFRRGGGYDISYECNFDRNGRIYDGHYRFH